MSEMPEEVKQRLRGRPRNGAGVHKFGSETERKEWGVRLDGCKHSRGLRLLKRYYSGVLLKPREAIVAMCCECLGYYADVGSMADCENPRCPLYYYMPYRRKTKPTI